MRRFLLPASLGLFVAGAALIGQYLARSGSVETTTLCAAVPALPAPQANPAEPQSAVFQPAAAIAAATQPSPLAPATRLRQVLDMPDPDRLRRVKIEIQDRLIESQYGRLIRQFGLNQAETECFKRLLADRDTQRMDLNRMLLYRNLPPGQRLLLVKANRSKLAAIDQASDATIRRFLNHDDDFRIYQQWQDTAPERQQATSLNSIFTATGHHLSPEQSDQLVDVTVAVRKASRPSSSTSPSRTSSDKVSDQRAQWERQRAEADDQSILAQAANFLSPEQLKTLEQAQEGWRMVKHPAQPAPGTAGK